MEQIINPHDKLFRETWSDVATARAFLQQYLPPALLARLHLGTLEIVKDSFIDQELQEYFSDLLYRITIDKHVGYIYLLFEHKSYPERHIHLQLLEYLLRIWRQDFKQRVKNQYARRLPIIVPLVLYHGKRPWRIKRRFAELFHRSAKTFQPYIPDFEYVLFDLTQYADDHIKGVAFFQVVLLLFKHVFDADFAEKLPEILRLMNDVLHEEEGLRSLELVLRYIYTVTGAAMSEQITQIVTETLQAKGGEISMTIAEKWQQEGWLKGRQEGRQEGRLEGRLEAKQEGLLETIEVGVGIKFGEEQAAQIMPFIRPLHDLNELQAIKEGMKRARDIAEFMAVLKAYIKI